MARQISHEQYMHQTAQHAAEAMQRIPKTIMYGNQAVDITPMMKPPLRPPRGSNNPVGESNGLKIDLGALDYKPPNPYKDNSTPQKITLDYIPDKYLQRAKDKESIKKALEATKNSSFKSKLKDVGTRIKGAFGRAGNWIKNLFRRTPKTRLKKAWGMKRRGKGIKRRKRLIK
jgi:hypothetical protein